jgi:hypothetical protein
MLQTYNKTSKETKDKQNILWGQILTQTRHSLIFQSRESLSPILLNCNRIFHLNLQL